MHCEGTVRLPVTALALSAHRPFGPARFACGLDKDICFAGRKFEVSTLIEQTTMRNLLLFILGCITNWFLFKILRKFSTHKNSLVAGPTCPNIVDSCCSKFQSGVCDSPAIQSLPPMEEGECQRRCRAEKDCLYYSSFPDACILHSSCPLERNPCQGCRSGPKRPPLDKLAANSGDIGTTTHTPRNSAEILPNTTTSTTTPTTTTETATGCDLFEESKLCVAQLTNLIDRQPTEDEVLCQELCQSHTLCSHFTFVENKYPLETGEPDLQCYMWKRCISKVTFSKDENKSN